MELQPARQNWEGAVEVRWTADYERILISSYNDDVPSVVTLGPHNAWRVFGMLAFILGISLPKSVLKSIKL